MYIVILKRTRGGCVLMHFCVITGHTNPSGQMCFQFGGAIRHSQTTGALTGCSMSSPTKNLVKRQRVLAC